MLSSFRVASMLCALTSQMTKAVSASGELAASISLISLTTDLTGSSLCGLVPLSETRNVEHPETVLVRVCETCHITF